MKKTTKKLVTPTTKLDQDKFYAFEGTWGNGIITRKNFEEGDFVALSFRAAITKGNYYVSSPILEVLVNDILRRHFVVYEFTNVKSMLRWLTKTWKN